MIVGLFSITANAQYLLEEMGPQKSKEKETTTKYKEAEDSRSFNFGEYGINKGYRGFVDVGFGIPTGDGSFTITGSTSHGYQIIDNYLFVGAGLGYMYMEDSALPIFADLRSDCLNFGRCSLFVDARIGYSVAWTTGLFLDPQIGCRFALNDKLGLNFSVGVQTLRHGDYNYYEDLSSSNVCFNIRLGIDF